MKNLLYRVALLAVVILTLAGCGKVNGLVGPHPDSGPAPPGPIGSPLMAMTIRAADQLAVEPAAGDPFFAVLAENWEHPFQLGTIDASGNITGGGQFALAALGEEHSIRFFFEHTDPVTNRLTNFPFMGAISLNGNRLVTLDQSTVWNQWFKFVATRNDSNQAVAISPRDDSGLFQWTEIVATGIDPGSIDDSLAVGGNRPMVFASTFSNMVELGGIFDSDAWHGIVMAKRGENFIFRPIEPGANNRFLLRGVYLKNPDGGLVLCTNLYDMDSGPGFFPAYIMKCNLDGTWSNLRDVDERPALYGVGN